MHSVIAHGWANETELDPDVEPDYPRMPEYLALLWLMVMEGQQEHVLHLFDHVQPAAESAERNDDLLTLLLLRAIARHDLDQADLAADAITRALEIGAPEGYMRTFLNEDTRLVPILKLAVGRDAPYREYVLRILDAFRGDEPKLANQRDKHSILSVRESEVLQLAASGLSNRDIADTLFISELTVKKHLSNVYVKLDVSSRTQAIDRARRHGLL